MSKKLEKKDKERTKEEVKEQCYSCIYFIRDRANKFSWHDQDLLRNEDFSLDCEIHGSYGWYFFASELQKCEAYQPSFKALMLKTLEEKND